jgi:hypothetical protein
VHLEMHVLWRQTNDGRSRRAVLRRGCFAHGASWRHGRDSRKRSSLWKNGMFHLRWRLVLNSLYGNELPRASSSRTDPQPPR